jgi:protein disulfide-isomerase A6
VKNFVKASAVPVAEQEGSPAGHTAPPLLPHHPSCREKAATALKGIVNVGAVDADKHSALGSEYKVQGFPTIKLIYSDTSTGKLKSVEYKGGRTAQDIVQWGMQQAQKIAMGRMGGAKGSGGSGRGSGSSGGGGGGGFYDGTAVVELTDDNFHRQVIDSDDMWFVEFYAPWCGHCKALKPAWIELAGKLEGKVVVGAVNCDENKATCKEFNLRGEFLGFFFKGGVRAGCVGYGQLYV